MTPIEKANEFVSMYLCPQRRFKELAMDKVAIDCAIICVDEIIDALISGGRDSFELQNMDKEFRFWYEVKDELNRMKL